MHSGTLIVNSTTLIAMISRFMSPIDDMLLPHRLITVETFSGLFHQIIRRLGKPLHLQALVFVWSSSAQALALLETAIFPEQPVSTPVHVDTPPWPCSFARLGHEDFQEYIHLADPINQLKYDAALVLENIALVLGLDLTNPRGRPGETAANAAPTGAADGMVAADPEEHALPDLGGTD
eukprot:s3597_g6.t1